MRRAAAAGGRAARLRAGGARCVVASLVRRARRRRRPPQPLVPMPPTRLATISRCLVTLAGATLLAFTLAATGASADTPPQGQGPGSVAPYERSFTVTHGPAVTQMVTAGSTGHRLGDLRVLPAMPIANATGAIVGRLDAQLVTTSVDYPTFGDEVRMSVLNFVFGEGTTHFGGSADQLQVSGSGYYPSTLSTIPVGTALVRPITGGSGVYAGASGWARTEHLADDTWRHTFYLLPTPRR